MEKNRLENLQKIADKTETTQVNAVYEKKDSTKDYTDFYNQEITGISELVGTTEEVFEIIQTRIKDYGEMIRSFHARQAAAVNFIRQNTHKLSVEAQAKFKLEDLTYKVLPPKDPRSVKKTGGVKLAETPEEKEKAYRDLAKAMQWRNKFNELDIEKAKKFVEDSKKG